MTLTSIPSNVASYLLLVTSIALAQPPALLRVHFIDGGDGSTAANYLLNAGIDHLDTLILTHPQNLGHANTLLNFPIKNTGGI